jgi:hypothetical protein
MHIEDMTYQTELGVYLNLFFQEKEGDGVELQRTIDYLSTPFFGSFERELLGGIYLQIMEIGKIPIVAFVAGEIMEYRRVYWKS